MLRSRAGVPVRYWSQTPGDYPVYVDEATGHAIGWIESGAWVAVLEDGTYRRGTCQSEEDGKRRIERAIERREASVADDAIVRCVLCGRQFPSAGRVPGVLPQYPTCRDCGDKYSRD